jgi:chromate transporter
VVWQLGRSAITDTFTAALAAIAALLLIRWKVSSAWLIVGGAAAAVVAHVL